MSEVKVNKISPKTACGTTTLGDSGDSFTIPSGVTITNNGTQVGFGRTGTVDWVTTPKTAGFAAASGSGYFCNTTGGIFTVTLPAGAAGSIVSLADYAATWQTNNVTVTPDGSEKIGGVNASVSLSTDTEGQSVTLVYVDSTQGWLNTMDSTSNVRAATFVAATGGTPCAGTTVCTNYKVHKFTGPGTFCVSCAGGPAGSNTVDYMVVAGGGAGSSGRGSNGGGAGGGGGFRESSGAASGCYTASPLGACVSALPVSASPYSIVVGAGGTTKASPAGRSCSGIPSSFSSITSTGGGAGGAGSSTPGPQLGAPGGSGGGSRGSTPPHAQGAGNTPPFSPPQGQPGAGTCGVGDQNGFGGGGATGAAPQCIAAAPGVGGTGGVGATTYISGAEVGYSGGGGGGGATGGSATQGGATGGTPPEPVGPAGTINTGGGGGGGGGSESNTGGAGGSGIVYIRYKFQ
jgi:hypothetical protein